MNIEVVIVVKEVLKMVAKEVIKKKFIQWLTESKNGEDKYTFSKFNSMRLKVFNENNCKIITLFTFSADKYTRVYWIDKNREEKDILFCYSDNYVTIFLNEDFVYNMYGLFAVKEDGERTLLISQFDQGFTKFKEDMILAWTLNHMWN